MELQGNLSMFILEKAAQTIINSPTPPTHKSSEFLHTPLKLELLYLPQPSIPTTYSHNPFQWHPTPESEQLKVKPFSFQLQDKKETVQ